jgi:hypothetical protein
LTQNARLVPADSGGLHVAPEMGRIPSLWDGQAAVRIIDALIEQDRTIHS